MSNICITGFLSISSDNEGFLIFLGDQFKFKNETYFLENSTGFNYKTLNLVPQI